MEESQGFEKEPKNYDGKEPIHLAVGCGYPKITKYLMMQIKDKDPSSLISKALKEFPEEISIVYLERFIRYFGQSLGKDIKKPEFEFSLEYKDLLSKPINEELPEHLNNLINFNFDQMDEALKEETLRDVIMLRDLFIDRFTQYQDVVNFLLGEMEEKKYKKEPIDT